MASVASGLTFEKRENTLIIDINDAIGRKATVEEWAEFLTEDVKVDRMAVKRVGIHSLTGMLMVTFSTPQHYLDALKKLEEGVMWTKAGTKVYGWDVQAGLTKVKLLNISEEMDVESLRTYMGKYGKVVSWKVNTWGKLFPQAATGSISVTMALNQGAVLEPFIRSVKLGEIVHVVGDNLERTCARCLKKGHIAAGCRSRRAVEVVAPVDLEDWDTPTRQGDVRRQRDKTRVTVTENTDDRQVAEDPEQSLGQVTADEDKQTYAKVVEAGSSSNSKDEEPRSIKRSGSPIVDPCSKKGSQSLLVRSESWSQEMESENSEDSLMALGQGNQSTVGVRTGVAREKIDPALVKKLERIRSRSGNRNSSY